jgi:hypothetical protein
MSYPRMLYRRGGEGKIHGHEAETLTVNDEQEEARAFADGWGFYEDLFGSGERRAEPRPEVESEMAALRTVVDELRTDLDAERAAHQAAEAERDQANETIADLRADLEAATAPAEPREKLTVGKRGGAASAAG